MHYFGWLLELCAVAIFFVGWQKIEMVQGQQYFVCATIYQNSVPSPFPTSEMTATMKKAWT
jgi:hypothetical protein